MGILKYNTLIKEYKYGYDVIFASRPVFSKPDTRSSYDYYSYSLVSESVNFRAYLDALPVIRYTNQYILSESLPFIMVYKEKERKRLFKSQLKLILDNFKDDTPQYNNPENAYKACVRFRDIVLMNQWSFFVTLTFAKENCDRYNANECSKLLQRFCKNYFRSHKGYYIFVPEYHESGALHFHGFIYLWKPDDDIYQKIDSGNGKPKFDKNGNPVYSLPAWEYGFSELSPFDSATIQKSIKYCLAYLKPDNKILPRWYYSGGQLARSSVRTYMNISQEDYSQVWDSGADSINVPALDCEFMKVYLDKNLDEVS